NSTRRRSSGTRQALASQERMSALRFGFVARCLGLCGLWLGRGLLGLLGLGFTDRSGPALTGLLDLRLLEEGEGAAGSLDLLAGGRRGGVHGDRELPGELADAEELHVLADRADEALRLQRLGRDLLARLEAVEVAKVHRLGIRAERPDRH